MLNSLMVVGLAVAALVGPAAPSFALSAAALVAVNKLPLGYQPVAQTTVGGPLREGRRLALVQVPVWRECRLLGWRKLA
jgi:hypothetical protein